MATSWKAGSEVDCSRSWWHHLRPSLKNTMNACVYFSKHLYFRYSCIFPGQIGGINWHWTYKNQTLTCSCSLSARLSLGTEKHIMGLLETSWSVKELHCVIPQCVPVGYAWGILQISPWPRPSVLQSSAHPPSALTGSVATGGGACDLPGWESCFGNSWDKNSTTPLCCALLFTTRGHIHEGFDPQAVQGTTGNLQLAVRCGAQGYKALQQPVRHLYRQTSHST